MGTAIVCFIIAGLVLIIAWSNDDPGGRFFGSAFPAFQLYLGVTALFMLPFGWPLL